MSIEERIDRTSLRAVTHEEAESEDMDIWISVAPQNLQQLVEVLVKFGFDRASIDISSFTGPKSVFRMGVPPNRLEVITRIAGVDFDECYSRRQVVNIEGLPVNVIALEDLKRNKRDPAPHAGAERSAAPDLPRATGPKIARPRIRGGAALCPGVGAAWGRDAFAV